MNFIKGLRVVIVNGRPGVGKTTFEDCCEEILGPAFCKRRSTVDKIKELAKEAGWKGEKTPAARKMLSDLKDIFTEYNDMPIRDIVNFLHGFEDDLECYSVNNHPHILFVDDREPEHIDRLKTELHGITVLVRRPGDEEMKTSNHADENVFNYDYDYVIENTGTLEDLRQMAQAFINSIFS